MKLRMSAMRLTTILVLTGLFVFTSGCGGGGGAVAIAFLTSALQNAIVNQAYNATIQISGATTPVTWEIIAGNLP